MSSFFINKSTLHPIIVELTKQMKQKSIFVGLIFLAFSINGCGDIVDRWLQYRKNSYLYDAAKYGCLSRVKAAWVNGASINTKLPNGATALLVAAERGHVAVVEFLLDHGADIKIRDTATGSTALWFAAQNGHANVVELLLYEGADVEARDKANNVTALWAASERGHTKAAGLLLNNGAEANTKRPEDDISALYLASQNGHLEVVKLLLNKGAMADTKRSNDGVTALFIASENGHAKIVKQLSDKGADINVKVTIDNVEWTPLKAARKMKQTDVIAVLKQAGAKE